MIQPPQPPAHVMATFLLSIQLTAVWPCWELHCLVGEFHISRWWCHGLALTSMPKLTSLSLRLKLHCFYLSSSGSLSPMTAHPEYARKIRASANRGLSMYTTQYAESSFPFRHGGGQETAFTVTVLKLYYVEWVANRYTWSTLWCPETCCWGLNW